MRKFNVAVYPIVHNVPDVNVILAAIPADSKWYTAIDLCSAYFSIPVHEDMQDLFAFTCKNEQFVFTRLPMGFLDSAAAYATCREDALVSAHFTRAICADRLH